MIDKNLKEFFSINIRRKIYAAASIIQVLMASVSGIIAADDYLSSKVSEYPLIITVLSSLGALVTLMAKANINEEDEELNGYKPKHLRET